MSLYYEYSRASDDSYKDNSKATLTAMTDITTRLIKYFGYKNVKFNNHNNQRIDVIYKKTEIARININVKTMFVDYRYLNLFKDSFKNYDVYILTEEPKNNATCSNDGFILTVFWVLCGVSVVLISLIILRCMGYA